MNNDGSAAMPATATSARMAASKASEVLRLVRADETVAEDDWRLALDAALYALARQARIEALAPGDMLFYFGTSGDQPPIEMTDIALGGGSGDSDGDDTPTTAAAGNVDEYIYREGYEHAP